MMVAHFLISILWANKIRVRATEAAQSKYYFLWAQSAELNGKSKQLMSNSKHVL